MQAVGPADEDEGPQDGPNRLCIATRTVRPVDELIRFVAAPDGRVVPDLKRKLPGRGVWVTATRGALREAVKRKAFARGLKAPVTVPPALPEEVEALLVRTAREGVSLARKAGLVVTGFSKVEAAIAGNGVQALLHASDAAPDGVRKLAQAVRRRHGDHAESIPVLGPLESSELDLALGRSHVIHAALMKGSASRACLARLRALERYRDDGPAPTRGADHPAGSTTQATTSRETSFETSDDPRTGNTPGHEVPAAERQDSERND